MFDNQKILHPFNYKVFIIRNVLRGRSQFTFTVFSPFLTTHLPLVYNRLHLTNHLPIVNVYIWNLTTPNNMYLILLNFAQG